MLDHIMSYRNPGRKIALEQTPVRELPEVGTRVASKELFIYVFRLSHDSTCKQPSIVGSRPHPRPRVRSRKLLSSASSLRPRPQTRPPPTRPPPSRSGARGGADECSRGWAANARASRKLRSALAE